MLTHIEVHKITEVVVHVHTCAVAITTELQAYNRQISFSKNPISRTGQRVEINTLLRIKDSF